MCSTSVALDGVTRSALLLQARKGDRDSLARLILPYATGVYLGALRLTRNLADAEDVRQEAFLKAMTRLEQFSGTSGEQRDDMYAWVSRIATNASIDVIRKRRDGKLCSLDESVGENDETIGSKVSDGEDNPEERFAKQQTRRLMSDAITQLPRDLRQVCLLRDVCEYSTQEVADRLGISAMAVRLRLFRAHRRLREKLSYSLSSSKQRQSRVTSPVRVDRTPPPTRIPSFAECACGD